MIKKNNEQKVHKKRTTSQITIPSGLRQAVLDLNLTNTYTQHSYKFIGILLRESYSQHGDIFQMVDMPRNYFTTVFDDKYVKWLKPLLAKGVILRNSFYFKESHQSYKYCVNPLYYNIENIININIPLCVENTCDPLITVAYKDIVKERFEDNVYRNHFKGCMDELSIDYDKLTQLTQEITRTLSINDFVTDMEIKDHQVFFRNNGNEYKIPKDMAIEKAHSSGKILIKDKSRCIIDSPNEFIDRKKVSILSTYDTAIATLKSGNLRASRNLTNNRLDTNITNLGSALTDEICNQNDLIQIDLRNSQFSILCHILKDKLDSPDFKRFMDLSVSGELYDFIKDNLGLKTREDGKNEMFQVLFSSRKNYTPAKIKIMELFPSVMRWVDRFKKENGKKEFAVMLQRKESEIFIDNILKTVIKKKMFALTKHDSLIVKRNDFETIINLMEEFFKSIDFQFHLKFTYPDSY